MSDQSLTTSAHLDERQLAALTALVDVILPASEDDARGGQPAASSLGAVTRIADHVASAWSAAGWYSAAPFEPERSALFGWQHDAPIGQGIAEVLGRLDEVAEAREGARFVAVPRAAQEALVGDLSLGILDGIPQSTVQLVFEQLRRVIIESALLHQDTLIGASR